MTPERRTAVVEPIQQPSRATRFRLSGARIEIAPQRLAAVEWLLLGLAAPMLLVPGWYTPIGLVFVAAAWGIRRAVTGSWSVPSRAHGPSMMLVLALLIALTPSVRLDYSSPKFFGIVLGLAVFYACLNTCRSDEALRRAGLILLGFGAVLAIGGVLYMAEPGSKLFGRDVYSLLPDFDRRVQTSTIAIWGINANQVGGTIALFAPLAVALVFERGSTRRLALGSAVLLLGALILTQSRASIGGVAVALLVGACWAAWRRGRWGRALLAVLAAGCIVALVLSQPDRLGELVQSVDVNARLSSSVGRLELWQRALAMILDMPFTGVGLNNFSVIVLNFYPGVVSAEYFDPTSVVPHTHNFILQAALDVGLPGLAAFVVIVALAVRGGLAAVRGPASGGLRPGAPAAHRLLAAGLLLGLLAHGIYGLADAVALGAKPGVALWAVLGVLVALGERWHSARAHGRGRGGRQALVRIGLLLCLPLLGGPALLNGALVVLHRPELATVVDRSALHAGLDLARQIAWGPYPGRLWAAEALAAQSRGDADAELVALDEAIRLSPWDPSLPELKSEAQILRSEPNDAVETWGGMRVVDVLVRRVRAAPITVATELFGRAQAAAPDDSRIYLAASEVLVRSERPGEAAAMLAKAISLRKLGTWGDVLAGRLLDRSTPLPSLDAMPTGYARDNSVLFARAADVLERLSDSTGAGYARELARRSSGPA
jgi:putative inorganic carbon (HCO3(-)) transporter